MFVVFYINMYTKYIPPKKGPFLIDVSAHTVHVLLVHANRGENDAESVVRHLLQKMITFESRFIHAEFLV